MIRVRQLNVTIVAAFLMAGGIARAQTNTSLQLNLSAPGARSLAMGGAFLGLADDATAAYTNPAGLTNLTVGGPEVAVEFRSWGYASLYPKRGNFSPDQREDGSVTFGQPTGIGIDTKRLEVGEAQSSTRGLSFLSFGYVLPHHVTLALYRHELAHYKTDQVQQGFFFVSRDLYEEGFCEFLQTPPANTDCRLLSGPQRELDDIKIENFGVSVAYDVSDYKFLRNKGSLSLGIGLSLFRLSQSIQSTEFKYSSLQRDHDVDRRLGGFFGPPDLADDNIKKVTEVSGNGTSPGVNAGFLWKIGSKQLWSLGGVFRQGPSFETETRDSLEPKVTRGTFHLPDSCGLGIAYAPNQNTKIALDYDRVFYSQGFKDLPKVFRDHARFRIRDADEVHVGLEQIIVAIPSQFVGVLRLGAWRETAHELEYTAGIPPGDPLDNPRLFAEQGQALLFKTLLPRGQDVYHWSAGLGLVIKEDFQVDAAFERSDRVNTLSFSVVRFF